MLTKTQDAIALLKADHRLVEDLFEEFSTTTGAAKQKTLARKICTELMIHITIEEEVFYPALARKIKADTVDEAYVEHDGAKLLIGQIMAGAPGDKFFDAKVTVLAEEIKHHVKEEEMAGDGMFAQARAADVDLAELGRLMLSRKAELKAEFEARGLPVPTARTLSMVEIELGKPVA